MGAGERIDEEHEEEPGVDAYVVVSHGADGVDVGAVVLRGFGVRIADFKGWGVILTAHIDMCSGGKTWRYQFGGWYGSWKHSLGRNARLGRWKPVAIMTMSPSTNSSRPGPPFGTPFALWLNRIPVSVKPMMSPRSHSALPERI